MNLQFEVGRHVYCIWYDTIGFLFPFHSVMSRRRCLGSPGILCVFHLEIRCALDAFPFWARWFKANSFRHNNRANQICAGWNEICFIPIKCLNKKSSPACKVYENGLDHGLMDNSFMMFMQFCASACVGNYYSKFAPYSGLASFAVKLISLFW